MRKTIVLLLGLVVAVTITAERVSESEAALVAHNFMNNGQAPTGGKQGAPSRKMILKEPAATHENAFYVYESPDGGWVMVAADNVATPILAYSPTGSFKTENQPDNLRLWLEQYNQSIAAAEAEGLTAGAEVAAKWRALRSGKGDAKGTVIVSPLIKTKWNQAEPYNDLCPYDKDYKENAVTGCVATAMAQVMAYWKHPSKGMGYHSYTHPKYGLLSANFASTKYDWDNLLSNYSSTSSDKTQRDAVATLMSHCGISTEMNYGVADEGGSGTYMLKKYCKTGTDNPEYALKTYFDYDIKTSGMRDEDISKTKWLELLKNDLDNGRPVLYAGQGSGGHCFVCDGYDDADFFHFNWGWGGHADGYFQLDALEPIPGGIGGGGYVFNDYQMAIFGLQPHESSSEEEVDEDIRLYSKIMAPDSVRFYNDLVDSVRIANYNETKDIDCTIAAVLFDENGNFYDFVDSISGTFLAYNFFTYETTYKGCAAFTPGDYYMAYFYHTDTKGWTMIESDKYDPVKLVRVWYEDGIEVYSDFELQSGEFKQGKEVELQLSFANVTGATFKGSVRLNLANISDGSWAQNIEIISDVEIEDYHYDTYTFKGNITVKPGTYLLEAAYMKADEDAWYYAGSKYNSNPIRVVVEAKDIMPDPYENNDKPLNAYSLKPKFDASGKCTFTISDATLHVGTDVDYYAIDLPANESYTITPQSFDATTDNNYTASVTSCYYTSKSQVTHPFDADATSFTTNGGLTLYFKTTPLLSGGKGTYGLKIKVQKKVTDTDKDERGLSDPEEEANSPVIKDGAVHCDGEISVYTPAGQLIRTAQNGIRVDDLPDGVYVIQANGETIKYLRQE